MGIGEHYFSVVTGILIASFSIFLLSGMNYLNMINFSYSHGIVICIGKILIAVVLMHFVENT